MQIIIIKIGLSTLALLNVALKVARSVIINLTRTRDGGIGDGGIGDGGIVEGGLKRLFFALALPKKHIMYPRFKVPPAVSFL